ncbi:complement decay-accelerating factor isoform X2 [Talpa occidentalis]|uniref:complement decay-accelerating factor isoform X2 n=1 Tax=Talpa occidentalis TaxID=50954 RepID=UPI0018902432|nr:complement decay-accelerating factor isoform X2 [Talpa occidentalis]
MRGDCSLPPDVPNAQPDLRGLSSFPQDTTITYKCSEGFVKVPSLPDSIVCLESEWSEIAEFCNRSCAVPPRLLFAALKKIYSKQNYFPAGSTVEYECRMGYKRDPRLSGQLTCLQDFAWSKPVEFCKKKSCPNPGEIKNGHINITTDILFGASIFFSCNTGYKLEGETSSYCSLADNTVRWSHPLPECKEIHCPDPPEIANGTIQEPQTTYVYQQSVTYRCAKGFQLVGGSSIYCTMKGDQPAWSSPVPACKESSQISKVTPAVQKPTTVTAPGTKPKPTPHKPTPASAPGTKPKPTHQKPTSANAPVKQSPAAPKATTRVHTTSTAKGQGPPPSGANNIAVALTTQVRTAKASVSRFVIN